MHLTLKATFLTAKARKYHNSMHCTGYPNEHLNIKSQRWILKGVLNNGFTSYLLYKM